MRGLYHPSTEELRLSSIFYALSDPVRLQMVMELLEKEEVSCGAFNIDLAKSTMSHHFKVLRESGVTRTDIRGTQRLVSLRRTDIEERFPGLISVLHNVVNPL